MFNFLKFFGIYRLIKGFILKNAKESVRIHTFLAIFNVRILWIRDVFFCFSTNVRILTDSLAASKTRISSFSTFATLLKLI